MLCADVVCVVRVKRNTEIHCVSKVMNILILNMWYI